MKNEQIQDTISALDELLDAERRALLSGELDKIARLHDRKSALVEDLSKLDLKDQEQLRDLSQKVGRNQELLTSALDGIRAVAKRLAAVRHVRENLETYDERGKKNTVATNVKKTLEKRA